MLSPAAPCLSDAWHVCRLKRTARLATLQRYTTQEKRQHPMLDVLQKADTGPDKIDLNSDESLDRLSRQLAVTLQQLKDGMLAVGDSAPAVELHLKGSSASTNDDQIDKAGV